MLASIQLFLDIYNKSVIGSSDFWENRPQTQMTIFSREEINWIHLALILNQTSQIYNHALWQK